jgi:hypothetical protein
MLEETKPVEQERLEQLLQENIKLTQEIHRMSKRINRYVTVQNILSVVYFILIVVPLVLGAIYLPHFIKNVFTPYQKLLDSGNNLQNAVSNPSPAIGDILNQAQKILNEKNNK